MNASSKLGLMTLSLIAVTALSACQSTQNTASTKTDQVAAQHHGHMKGHHGDSNMHNMYKHNKGQHSAGRQQMFEQMQAACKDKTVGQSVEVKFKDKAITGQCQLGFQANDPKQFKTQFKSVMQQQVPNDSTARLSRTEIEKLSVEQRTAYRNEKRQSNQVRREQHRQQWQNIQAQCQGKTVGSAVQVKLGEQHIQGQCQLQFQPEPTVMHHGQNM